MMKTVTCENDSCAQLNVVEHYCGDPEVVMCGVCGEPCALGDLTDDPDLEFPA